MAYVKNIFENDIVEKFIDIVHNWFDKQLLLVCNILNS